MKLKVFLPSLAMVCLLVTVPCLAQTTTFTWSFSDPYTNTFSCQLDYYNAMYYEESYTFVLSIEMTKQAQNDYVRFIDCDLLLDATNWLSFSLGSTEFNSVGTTKTFSLTFTPQVDIATNGLLSIKLSYTTYIVGATYDGYRIEDVGDITFSIKPAETIPPTTEEPTTSPPRGIPGYPIEGILIGLILGFIAVVFIHRKKKR
ncbi:MAG: Loki-CTERM sorting domain-containing protein [Promethearchaeota archaeon]